jgi:hypothetical protein
MADSLPQVLSLTGEGYIGSCCIKVLNPTGHVMHQQFNIQQLYALPTLYRVFQKELYNFESVLKFIQRTYTTF